MDHLEDTNRTFPEDLFSDILSHLPVRDLLRFRCVSKSWLALIDDPSFIETHNNAQYALHKARCDLPFLLWKNLRTIEQVYPIQCHLLSKQNGQDTFLNLTSDLERSTNSIFPNHPYIYFDVFCRGSANGIICLQFEGLDKDQLGRGFYSCGLWNPASRQVKTVAYPHVPDQREPGGSSFTVVGFGVDPLSNDFKIVATTVVDSDNYLLYMVYSLSTDSWKRVSQLSLSGSSVRVSHPQMDACFKGVHYWATTLILNEFDQEFYFKILSYDFSTEVFKFSDPPQGAPPPVSRFKYGHVSFNIGLYKESIALFYTHMVDRRYEKASVDIWVVTEFKDGDFGVPLEWQCLFSIKQQTNERLGSWFGAQRMDGDILFSMFDDELCLYNPATGHFQRMGIIFESCFGYVESMFSLSRRVGL